MFGGIANKLDALREGLRNFYFVLSSFAEVFWFSCYAAVIEQRHDLYFLAFLSWIVNIVFHKLLLEFC